MITATMMPTIDVTYDAIPRSRAVLVAPLDCLRRANTAAQRNQNTQHTRCIHAAKCLVFSADFTAFSPAKTEAVNFRILRFENKTHTHS